MMVEFHFVDPARQIPERSEVSDLKNHFTKYYNILVEAKIVPHAAVGKTHGITRTFCGLSMPYTNMVLGVPEGNWDAAIQEQIAFFTAQKVPFVWYVDVGAQAAFKQKLIDNGFADTGMFRAISGPVDAIPPAEPDVDIEEVKDAQTLDAFAKLVCDTFGFEGADRDAYKQAMKNDAFAHFVAKKEGRVVSCLTAFIDGTHISFWNGATLAEYRKLGLSTSLRRFALHARPKGCTTGASYLMAEGMALGICEKLGFITKWQFHAFVHK